MQFGLPVSDALIKLYMEMVSFNIYVDFFYMVLTFYFQIVLFTDYTLWKFTKKVGKIRKTPFLFPGGIILECCFVKS